MCLKFGRIIQLQFEEAMRPFSLLNPLEADATQLIHRQVLSNVSSLFSLGLSSSLISTHLNQEYRFRDLRGVTEGEVLSSQSPLKEPSCLSLRRPFRDQALESPQSGGYVRLTKAVTEILRRNRYLSVESDLDQESQFPGGVEFWLVRYAYPSAKNYVQFANLLSQALVRKLRKAESLGQAGMKKDVDENSPLFRELTRSLLRELWESLRLNFESNPESSNSLKFLSIAPFLNQKSNEEAFYDSPICSEFRILRNPFLLLHLDVVHFHAVRVSLAKIRRDSLLFEPKFEASSDFWI